MIRFESEIFIFRVGHTKFFFRAGVLGYLEEIRDEKVTKLLRQLQVNCSCCDDSFLNIKVLIS